MDLFTCKLSKSPSDISTPLMGHLGSALRYFSINLFVYIYIYIYINIYKYIICIYIYICIFTYTYDGTFRISFKIFLNQPGDDDDDDVYLYKAYDKRVLENLFSICFHTDQPKRHKYRKISMIIRNEGSINNNQPISICVYVYTYKYL
jgi:hypothetical protein